MPGLCKWEHTASTFLGKLVAAFIGKRPCGNGSRHSKAEVGQAVPLDTELQTSIHRDDAWAWLQLQLLSLFWEMPQKINRARSTAKARQIPSSLQVHAAQAPPKGLVCKEPRACQGLGDQVMHP